MGAFVAPVRDLLARLQQSCLGRIPLGGRVRDRLELTGIQVARGLARALPEGAALALKGVDDEMQKKFLKNMSSRAAEMLVEDMEAKGPVKLSEVEAAQKEILAVARKLEESGEIVLVGGGEEMMV